MSSTYEQTAELELNGDLEESAPRARADRLPALVIGVAALTLFFVAQILTLFPGLAGFQIAKITALLVALIFLGSRDRLASRVRVRSAPPLKYAVAMLVFAAITIPFAVWPQASLRFITDVYAKNIIFVYLLAQASRSDRDSRVIAGSLALGCSALVLAMLTGFGPLVTLKLEPDRLAVGSTYDANDLALLFIVTIPFAFFMLKQSRPLQRALLIAAIALMLIGIVKTGSRGGFLGLVVIGGLILMRGSAQARKYTLLTIAAGIVLFVATAPPAYWSRINTIINYQNDYNLKDDGGRLIIWQNGLEMVARNPVTGVGISCFPIAHIALSGSRLEMSPHNSFLQVAAELGIPGLALFLAIIIGSLRAARRARRRAREGLANADLVWLASAIEVSFIGFVVSGSLLTHAYSAIFCFLVGMSAALHARSKADREQEAITAKEVEYV